MGIEQTSHVFFAQRFITLKPSYKEVASFKLILTIILLWTAYINPSYFLLIVTFFFFNSSFSY